MSCIGLNFAPVEFFFRSMLARDLQSIVVYDLEGKFAGIRRPNSKLPIEIDGMKIVIEDAIGSTGLELKVQNLLTRKEETSLNRIYVTSLFFRLVS